MGQEKLGPVLRIDSFKELLAHEKEILDQISETTNGGYLFMMHPFMLLEDIGVQLSEQAKKEIMRREPVLSALSPTPYEIMKRVKTNQRYTVHLHGLFKGNSK